MVYKAEYIWIDGTEPTPKLRSKTKIITGDGELPIWGFDGSSTNQATGDKSDCVLKPVAVYPDPIRGGDDNKPGSRRLHAGHRLANQQAPARPIPGTQPRPVSMPPILFGRFDGGSFRSPSRSPPDASRAPFPHRSPRRSSANAA